MNESGLVTIRNNTTLKLGDGDRRSSCGLVTIRNNTTLKHEITEELVEGQFGYHQKQHNSQTINPDGESTPMFGYHQKQHNSQTYLHEEPLC